MTQVTKLEKRLGLEMNLVKLLAAGNFSTYVGLAILGKLPCVTEIQANLVLHGYECLYADSKWKIGNFSIQCGYSDVRRMGFNIILINFNEFN